MNSRCAAVCFSLLWSLLTWHCHLQAQTSLASAYAWHFPAPDTIRQADDLIEILRNEIDMVLNAGHLAPIRLMYGDLYWEHYFLYQEPGRILITLAWAWPYLTVEQQQEVLNYVENELAATNYAPWSPQFTMPRDEGSRREWYNAADIWGVDSNFGDFRPRLHTLYGFWLFCYRSGQTDLIPLYYNQAKSFYQLQHNRAKLYGDMCGHLAMARLAAYMGDDIQRDFALQRLEVELQEGLDIENKHAFARDGFLGWDAPYNRSPGSPMYESRKDGWIYRGFIFLNMGPEVARFLRDSCYQQVDSMHQYGKNLLPLWWMMQAPYFPRWTGDESIGVPSEAFGMYHPVENWILDTPASQLRRYMRSSPTGIGDCYWLEALAQTIEAHSTSEVWIDVRDTPFPDIVIGQSTGSHHIKKPVIDIRLAPNPASTSVAIEWVSPSGGPVYWQITDQQGKLMSANVEPTLPATRQIMLAGWPKGAYTLSAYHKAARIIENRIIIVQ